MKKVIFIFLLLFNTIFLTAQEHSQNISIQVGPLPLIFGLVSIGTQNNNDGTFSYEFSFDVLFKINNYWNLAFRHYIFGSNNLGPHEINRQKSFGIGFEPGVMFRPFGTGLRGMYIGLFPVIGWQNERIDDYLISVLHAIDIFSGIVTSTFHTIDVSDNFLLLGIAIEIGYVWIFNNGFSIRLGGGFGNIWSIESRNNSIAWEWEERNFFSFTRIALLLGYTF